MNGASATALCARVAEALPRVARLTIYRLSPSLQTFVKVSAAAMVSAYKGTFASRGQIDDVTCAYDEPYFHRWLAARYER